MSMEQSWNEFWQILIFKHLSNMPFLSTDYACNLSGSNKEENFSEKFAEFPIM